MLKDEKKANAKIFTTMGASNHTYGEREENDFYATDPRSIDDLLAKEQFDNLIWEPAVGMGHMALSLYEKGYTVFASDILNRGWPDTEIIDFVNTDVSQFDFDGDIITNPPYKYCLEFVLQSLKAIKPGHKVAMFLKLTALEGGKRYEELYSKYPPKTVYVYAKRIICAKNGDFDKVSGSAVCYAWFVWEKGFTGKTTLDWIY